MGWRAKHCSPGDPRRTASRQPNPHLRQAPDRQRGGPDTTGGAGRDAEGDGAQVGGPPHGKPPLDPSSSNHDTLPWWFGPRVAHVPANQHHVLHHGRGNDGKRLAMVTAVRRFMPSSASSRRTGGKREGAWTERQDRLRAGDSCPRRRYRDVHRRPRWNEQHATASRRLRRAALVAGRQRDRPDRRS